MTARVTVVWGVLGISATEIEALLRQHQGHLAFGDFRIRS